MPASPPLSAEPVQHVTPEGMGLGKGGMVEVVALVVGESQPLHHGAGPRVGRRRERHHLGQA